MIYPKWNNIATTSPDGSRRTLLDSFLALKDGGGSDGRMVQTSSSQVFKWSWDLTIVIIVLFKKHLTTTTVIIDDEDDKDVDKNDSDDGDVDVGCAHQEKSLVLFDAIAQRTILGRGGYPGWKKVSIWTRFVFKMIEIKVTIISVVPLNGWKKQPLPSRFQGLWPRRHRDQSWWRQDDVDREKGGQTGQLIFGEIDWQTARTMNLFQNQLFVN